MGGLGCQGSFIPTVVAPCLSLGGETEQGQMGLKGLLWGVRQGAVKALQGCRVGSEPTGWRTWMRLVQGQGQHGEGAERED